MRMDPCYAGEIERKNHDLLVLFSSVLYSATSDHVCDILLVDLKCDFARVLRFFTCLAPPGHVF